MNPYGILLLAILLFYTPLRSQETEKTSSKTIKLGLSYFSESFLNLKGGAKTGTNYKGFLNFSGDFDLDKLIGVKRTALFFNFFNVHGKNISERIGDDLLVSNIEAQPGTRLQNLWLQYQLKNEKLLFRFGKQAIDDEFLTTEISNLFLHGVAAYPFTLSNNYPQWPVASLSILGIYQLNNLWKIQAGIYQAGSEVIDESINTNGLDFSLNPSGYTLISEANFSKKNDFYRFGFMHDTNAYSNAIGNSKNGLSSIYFAVDKQLINTGTTPENGLYVFASASTATNWDYANFDYDLRTALSWKHGLFAKNTQLGIGYFYPHLGKAVRPSPSQVLETEQFTEITYKIAVNNWCLVQASFQKIINPGAARLVDLPNASVIAFRSYFVF